MGTSNPSQGNVTQGSATPGGGGSGTGGSASTSTRPTVAEPRVGKVEDGVAWTGGSNLVVPTKAKSVTCFRPLGFRDRQKLEDSLKSGLVEDRRLEIGGKVSAMVFVKEFCRFVEAHGLDTVFRVVRPSGEIYLLTDWGQVTLSEVKDWVRKMKRGGAPWPGKVTRFTVCDYDLDNLELSAQAFRNSIGSKLYTLLESEAADDCSGPEYFKMAMMKMTGTSSQAVRILSNKLSEMKLQDEPGENVSSFSMKITELCKQLAGSGLAPSDMAFLAARAYTHASDGRWKTFAYQIANEENRQQDWKHWQDVVQKCNSEYEARINANDWSAAIPTKSKKEAQEDTVAALIAKEVGKITKVLQEQTGITPDGKTTAPKKGGCFQCGGAHFKKDCPQLKGKAGADGKNQPIEAWRKKPPGSGESKTKTVEGVEYEWCGKCLKGAGLWTKGKTKHGTDKHVTGYIKKKKEESKVSGNLATIPCLAGLEFVDGTLDTTIGFLAKY